MTALPVVGPHPAESFATRRLSEAGSTCSLAAVGHGMRELDPFCDVNGPIEEDCFKPSCGHVLEYIGIGPLNRSESDIKGGSHLTPPPASFVGSTDI